VKKSLGIILVFFALLLTGGSVLAQGSGIGWYDFVTDIRLHGQVWILNDILITDDVTAEDVITTDDVTAGDDVVATDDVFATDTISATWSAHSERSALTIGESGTITPTGTYQRLTSAGNVGTSSIANPTEGRLLILHNIGSNTITLTDTGTLKLSGNAALGNLDSVVLMADGTNWIQIAPEGDN
jgi:hypothetical protein